MQSDRRGLGCAAIGVLALWLADPAVNWALAGALRECTPPPEYGGPCLVAVERGEASLLSEVAAGPIRSHGRGLLEWWRPAASGVKHGFDLEGPPLPRSEVGEELVLGLRWPDARTVRYESGGRALRGETPSGPVRYSDLVVYDRDGAVVPSALHVRSEGIEIRIDDTAAVYPLLVDPLVDQPSWSVGGLGGRQADIRGDLNCDGYDDVVVQAPVLEEPDVSSVLVFYGGLGGPASTPDVVLSDEEPGSWFGKLGLDSSGDGDGDGCSDVLVGAPRHDGDLARQGVVYLFLGGPGGISSTAAVSMEGWAAELHFGRRVRWVGDVDANGTDDALAGGNDPTEGTGSVVLLLGDKADGLVDSGWIRQSFPGDARILTDFAGLGDISADGAADILVQFEAVAEIHLGVPGDLPDLAPGDPLDPGLFPWFPEHPPAAPVGDLDGDGYGDVAFPSGVVLGGAEDGLLENPIWELVSPTGASDHGVWAAADLDGDGLGELVLGGRWAGCEGIALDVYRGVGGGFEQTSSWSGVEYPYDPQEKDDVPAPGQALTAGGDVDGDGLFDVLVTLGDDEGPGWDGVAFLYTGTTSPTFENWYLDLDGDGSGDPASPHSQNPLAHTSDWLPCRWVTDSSDCDDTDPAVNGLAVEVCDGEVDEDCDGLSDSADPDCGDDDDSSNGDDDDDSGAAPSDGCGRCGQTQSRQGARSVSAVWHPTLGLLLATAVRRRPVRASRTPAGGRPSLPP